jgi:Carboxypeptidase regulatory-like domain/TonB-dependent Receptor Plug Domain/TonB dependent receptor
MKAISPLRLIASALAILVFSAVSAWGQSATTGALTVQVKDPGGAVIVGANVSVDNGAGTTRAGQTGADGSFTFTLLPPGTYTLTTSATGFQTLQQSSIVVDVTDTRVVTASLIVGAQEQKVTVNAGTEAIQTESSTLGGLVSGDTIVSLPLATRNYTQILSLSPGVTVSATNASAFGRGDQFIFANGMDDSSNTYMIDGAVASSYPSGTTGDYLGFYGSIAIPSPDAIQEFKVQTSNYDAEYGRTTGASVNLVTKSGSNNWHGTAFEFFRNTVLDANTYFANSTGQPRGVLNQNQFGGTVGGPVIKNKLFFFFSYQGTRQLNGVAYQGSSAINLPPQLTDTRTAAALGAAFCPANNPVASTETFSLTGTPNPATDQVACDGSNISPVALALLNYKLPNGTYVVPSPQRILNQGQPNEVGFSTYSDPASFSGNQEMLNADYAIDTKNSLSLKYLYDFSPATAQFYGSGLTAQSAEPPGGGNHSDSGAQNFVANWTRIISDNIINQFRYSNLYVRADLRPLWPVNGADIGMTPAAAYNPLTPDMVISSLGMTFGGISIDAVESPSTTYEWSDQLSWNYGRHSLRFGYDGSHVDWLVCSCGKSRGALTFQTFSDFLLGMSAAENGSVLSNVFASTASLQPFTNPNRIRENQTALFVQDDFKVNSRLTLNLGLRWEYMGWPYDANTTGGTDAYWSLLLASPIPPAGGTFQGLTVAKHFSGTVPQGAIRRSTNSLSATRSPLDNFAPRLGFAWQPLNANNRFVIRGGAGIFYQLIHGQQFLDEFGGEPPISAPFSQSAAANAAATLAIPFNPGVTPGTFNNFLRTPTSKIALNAINPDITTPMSFSWNLNIQYAFAPSWLLQVGYVGSRAQDIETGQAFDIPQLATATDPINCGGPAGCITTNTAANAIQRIPVLGFSPGGFNVGGNWGDSNYNSLQVSVKKDYSYGLHLQASYTYDKCINDVIGATLAGSGLGGSVNYDIGLQDLRVGRSQCGFDRPQRFVLNYVYNLPDFHSGNGFAGRALSGWGVSGVTTIQKGLPIQFTDTRAGAVYGSVGTAGANLCAGETKSDIFTSGSTTSRLNNYFNSSAFCVPPVVGVVNGMGGATGYGNLGSNVVLGPGQFNWDIGIIKNTKINWKVENSNLEFRAEFFNAFNHPQWSNPAANVASAGTFGVISSLSVGPRVMQFALKYSF